MWIGSVVNHSIQFVACLFSEKRGGARSMPPIQPSLRGSLLTGASALAMSAAWSGGALAQLQYAPRYETGLPIWTVWGEGAWFQTNGGSFNIPSVPGLGLPLTPLAPKSGVEGAFGFDYRWPDPVWHFVFDFRYGRSRTAAASSASSSQSTSVVQNVFPRTIPGGLFPTSTLTTTTKTSSSTQASEWENHLVADFMIGRDLGLGAHVPQVQFGIRVADLQLAASANTISSSTTTGTLKRTFYCPSRLFAGGVCTSIAPLPTSSASSTAFASWNSNFFGVGPRLALTQDVPLVGFWSFDYGAGVDILFGPRSLKVTTGSSTGPTTVTNVSSVVGVFNGDSFASLGYSFTPHMKLSGGIRADFYLAPLTTYTIGTGALTNIDRVYWGPFVRLTGNW